MYKENFYFKKYGYKHFLSDSPIDKDLELIVTIPVFNEPNIIPTLDSLDQCEGIHFKTEVILMINASEDADASIKSRNEETINEILNWIETKQNSDLKFHCIVDQNLPKKTAGVGLARKIAMDEAALRFHQIEKNGIIVCFDADSKCDPNYLRSIFEHFKNNPKTPGCSIYYEHPTEGDEFDPEVYDGIIQYELHLRYYNQAFRFTGHPAAFHTIGSSMACRSSAYEKQGGMNKRKAGEDFYFLQKIIELGNFTELNKTRVLPSPRPSDRVPFGTGKAISKWLDSTDKVLESYAFESFKDLKYFFDDLADYYFSNKTYSDLPLTLKGFLTEEEFEKSLKEIISNSTNYETFKKRFYRWFNAFKVLKFVHFCRDEFYPNLPITECVNDLISASNGDSIFVILDQLIYMRRIERSGSS